MIGRRVAAAVVGLALLGAACGNDTTDGSSAEVSPTTVGAVDIPRDDSVTGITRFAFEFQRIVSRTDENLVFSPASIGFAFAMAYAGADEATQATLEAALGFPESSAVHEQLQATLTALAASQSDDLEFAVANSGWAQAGGDVEQAYLDLIAEYYGAELETLDLQGEPEPSRERINEWISERTRERIPELLPPGFIDDSTVYVLVNAIYLNAKWEQVFGKYPTRPEAFTRTDGSTVDVAMMHNQELRARYLVEDGLEAVELPFAGGDLAMIVAIPEDLAALEASLDPTEWHRIVKGLHPGVVDLALPRWDIETTIDLAEPLPTFGVEIPGGDYSGIAPDLFLGQAVHGANMTVDEQGVEAAAATGLGFELSGPPPPDAVIRADRPFFYAIVHQPIGLILFSGHIVDPSA